VREHLRHRQAISQSGKHRLAGWQSALQLKVVTRLRREVSESIGLGRSSSHERSCGETLRRATCSCQPLTCEVSVGSTS
jgi:hypothetical protein